MAPQELYWVVIGGGVLIFLGSLHPLVWPVSGTSRLEAWSTVGFGVSQILWGAAHLSGMPGRDVIWWIAVSVMVVTTTITWRNILLRRRLRKQRP